MMSTKHDGEAELRQAKLQVTPGRIATLQIFGSHDRPVDAQHIIDHLQKDLGIDRVTVFRILKTFLEKGLIRKLEFGEGKARYELNKEEHHHLICQNCGRIDDIAHYESPQLTHDLKNMKGFLVRSHSVEYFGLCKNCQHE